MTKKNRLLICSLFMCMALAVLPGMKSSAEETTGGTSEAAAENQDENSQRLEEVTGMDENANIYEIEDTEGVVDESQENGIATFARAVPGPQVVNLKTKTVSKNTEYTDTATGDTGYTNGSYGADAAYLGMSGGKVKFMLSGVVGLVDAGEVQIVDLSEAKSVSHYMVSNGKLVHYISQNLNEETTSAITNGPAPSYLQSGTTYYSYDGHYFYTDYATMLSDYQNGVRTNSVNPGNPYYNYYQYLPLRSRSIYNADSLNSVISSKTGSGSVLRNIGTYLVQYQDTYGVNALLTLSIAANESGWGTSSISQNKNNLFGLNAVDSSPGQSANYYSSVEQCISEFMGNYMSAKYLNPKQWQYFGGFLGNKASGINVKYASDPYWGEKAASIAWTLDGLGGNADNGRYTIGIKEGSSTVNVRSEATTSSAVLYKTGSHLTHAVLILSTETENGFYRIQSDGVLNAERSSLASAWEYDFDSMYAYISADYVSVANTGTVEEPKPAELTGITIAQAPAKTVYTEGETPDMTGMQVTAQFSDGTETDVTADVTYPTEALTAGTTVITVSYTKDGVTVSADQAVTVNAAEVPVEEPDTPGEDADAAEEPADEPAAEEPADEPTAEEPADDTTAEKPSSDIPSSEQPSTDEPAADEPAADSTVTEKPSVDTPAEKPSADVPADEPTAEEPADDTTAEEPSSDIPSSEQPSGNHSVSDTLPADTPSADTSAGDASSTDTSTDSASDGNTSMSGETAAVTAEKTILDAATGIRISGSLSGDAAISIQAYTKEGERYARLVKPVSGKTILGVYDLTLTGTMDGNVQISFPVDSKYEGRKVTVLHYTDTDTYETYKATVENGKVTVTTKGFSPYVIALETGGSQNPAPKTGDSADLSLWAALIAVSGVLLATSAVTRRRQR